MAVPGLWFLCNSFNFLIHAKPKCFTLWGVKMLLLEEGSFVVIAKGKKHEIAFYKTQNVWDQTFSFIFFINKETLAKSLH